MDSRTFWKYVDKAEEKLEKDHDQRAEAFRKSGDPEAWQGQPNTGLELYLISVTNYERGTLPGVVYVLHRRLAAQRIVENTHVLATAEQIDKHMLQLEVGRREINQSEIRRQRTYVTQVPASGPATDSQEFNAAVKAAVADALKSMQTKKQ